MRIHITRPQQGRSRRRTTELMMGTALGGALMVLGAASPAVADDECGAPLAGVVTCTVAGGPYNSGVRYTGTPFKLNVEAGQTVAGGLEVDVAGPGHQHINAAGSRIEHATGDAVVVNNNGGATLIFGDVESTSLNGTAARVTAGGGSASFDSVTAQVYGLDVVNDGAGISFTATVGQAAVSGDGGAAVRVVSTAGGLAQATVGVVETFGENSTGIEVVSGYLGGVTSTGSVTTHGNGSRGVVATAANPAWGIAATTKAVETHGDDATAIEVSGGPITISGTSVTTHGDRSKGIVANGTGGDVTITVTEGVSTGDSGTPGRGAEATAIHAQLTSGDEEDDLTITVGTETAGGRIVTRGDDALGVYAHNNGGDVTLNMRMGEIETHGVGANGVYLVAAGLAAAEIGEVTTHGEGATGAYVNGAAVDVWAGEVTTTGDYSQGLYITALSGSADVAFGSVTTSGEQSDGVYVSAEDGEELIVNGGSITTSGRNAVGLEASGGDQQISLTGDITTAGFGASGVSIERADKIDLTVDDITTTGDQARGVNIAIDPEGQAGIDVDVTVGDVKTGSVRPDGTSVGRYSDGIFVWNTGSTTIEAASVTTQGLWSDGVLVDGTDELGQGAGTAAVTVRGDVTTNDGVGVHLTNVAGGSVTVGGTISTRGSGKQGVRVDASNPAAAAGAVIVDVKNITTTGDDADGVSVSAVGPVSIRTGDISTGNRPESQTWTGFRAKGVEASTQGSSTLSVTTGDIVTRMTGGHGVHAGTQTGLLTINTQNITTLGRETYGISAYTEGGNATIRAGDIDVGNATASASDRSKAVNVAMTDGGRLDMAVGNISVNGWGAAGVDIEAAGNSVVRVGDMSIHGLGANGLIFDGYATGTLDLSVGDIDVHGDDSNGVLIMDSAQAVVSTGSIHTRGALSHGVQLNSEGRPDVAIGDVTITTREGETVTTEGDGSYGIFIKGTTLADGSSVTLNLQDIVTGGAGSDAVLVQTHSAAGRIGINVRDVLTDGDNAAGVRVVGARQVDVALRNVQTTGANAYGVHVASADPLNSVIVTSTGLIDTAGDGAHGVYLEGETLASGRIMGVEMGGIRTGGDGADGVNMTSYEDAAAVFIAANTIVTEGERSRGVAFTGGARHVEIDIGAVNTEGDGAVGVDISGGRWIEAEIGQVWTSGAEAHAVSIRAQSDGRADVIVGSASASGDDAVAVNVEGRVANLTTTGQIVGRHGAVTLASMDGARLINRGSITSMGYAIEARGGAATITNEGGIFGRVHLTENGDSIANSGEFRAAGESEFGAGDDVFTNTGLLTLAEGANTATFLNLERFNNAGTIDLANGLAGDQLTLQGATLHGLDGGVIQMDLDLRGGTPAADLLTVGALSGVSAVELHVQGRGAVGDTGVTLIASGADQTGTEVEVTTVGGGFLDFNAVYDAASREFRVVAEAARQAFEPTRIASGAQTQWRRGADVVSARFDELRDSGAMGLRRGGTAQFWAQGFAGSEEVNGERRFSEDGTESVDLTHDVDARGAQFGVDIVRGLGGGDLVLGLAAGVGETELKFQSNGDTAEFSGGGVGAYAHWSSGPLAIGVQAKADRYDLDYRFVSADLRDSAEGETIGARVDATWRMPATGDWIFESQGSLAWTDTDLDGIEGEAGEVEFGDTRSVLARAGVRLARAVRMDSGAVVQPFVGVHRLYELDGENASRIHLNNQILDVTDPGRGTWTQFTAGANLGVGAVQGFAQGEATLGDVRGYTARVGVRLNW